MFVALPKEGSGRLWRQEEVPVFPPEPSPTHHTRCCQHTLVYKKFTRFCLAHQVWKSLYVTHYWATSCSEVSRFRYISRSLWRTLSTKRSVEVVNNFSKGRFWFWDHAWQNLKRIDTKFWPIVLTNISSGREWRVVLFHLIVLMYCAWRYLTRIELLITLCQSSHCTHTTFILSCLCGNQVVSDWKRYRQYRCCRDVAPSEILIYTLWPLTTFVNVSAATIFCHCFRTLCFLLFFLPVFSSRKVLHNMFPLQCILHVFLVQGHRLINNYDGRK